VVLAGQVGVRDHIHIGDRAAFGARAGTADSNRLRRTWPCLSATGMRRRRRCSREISSLAPRYCLVARRSKAAASARSS
jgi:UDP-3-O-[3-hydroxymyristoyl] glucosamine N-acyltransferase